MGNRIPQGYRLDRREGVEVREVNMSNEASQHDPLAQLEWVARCKASPTQDPVTLVGLCGSSTWVETGDLNSPSDVIESKGNSTSESNLRMRVERVAGVHYVGPDLRMEKQVSNDVNWVDRFLFLLPDDEDAWEAARWWLCRRIRCQSEGARSGQREQQAKNERPRIHLVDAIVSAERGGKQSACCFGDVKKVTGIVEQLNTGFREWLAGRETDASIARTLWRESSSQAKISTVWSALDVYRKIEYIHERLRTKQLIPRGYPFSLRNGGMRELERLLLDVACDARRVLEFADTLPSRRLEETAPIELCVEALERHEPKEGIWKGLRVEERAQLLVGLCRAEHGRWVVERTLCGWRWGRVKDERKRTHSELVSWRGLIGGELRRTMEGSDLPRRAYVWLNDLLHVERALGEFVNSTSGGKNGELEEMFESFTDCVVPHGEWERVLYRRFRRGRVRWLMWCVGVPSVTVLVGRLAASRSGPARP